MLVTDDLRKVVFGTHPGGGNPALHYCRVPPARDIAGRFWTPLCRLSMTLVVPRHMYNDGGSFSF